MKREIVIKEAPTGVELNKKLKSAMSTIDRKLKKLGVSYYDNAPYSTSGHFKMNENDSNTIQILTTSNLGYLINAFSLVKRMQKEYLETATDLGIKVLPVQIWCGFPMSSWQSDLERVISLVSNAEQITKLEQAKVSLSTFLSQEDRLFSTLTDLSELLK